MLASLAICTVRSQLSLRRYAALRPLPWFKEMQVLLRITLMGLMFVVALPLRSQTAKACRKSDQASAGIISELRNWVTTTDLERIRDRDSVYMIPVVSAAEIAIVTDDRTCKRAIDGYSKLPGGMRPVSLYVIKMGKEYFAVYDPLDKAGDMMTVHIMDRKFVSVGGWTGP